MLTFDEAEIQERMRDSSDLRSIRSQIASAEAQLEQSHQALANMPKQVRDSLLIEQQTALNQLLERGERTEAQARYWAIEKIKKAYVETLKAEANPLLEKAAKAIETARNNLLKVAAIESAARANNGSVMMDRYDSTSVDFFLPMLTYQADRGTWQLKRR